MRYPKFTPPVLQMQRVAYSSKNYVVEHGCSDVATDQFRSEPDQDFWTSAGWGIRFGIYHSNFPQKRSESAFQAG